MISHPDTNPFSLLLELLNICTIVYQQAPELFSMLIGAGSNGCSSFNQLIEWLCSGLIVMPDNPTQVTVQVLQAGERCSI